MLKADKTHNSVLWIAILYFAEGFPYTVVNLMSVIFLKDLGATNKLIGLTSFLYLPWVLKGFWGPLVDLFSTKRSWILATEVICTFLFFLLAFSVFTPHSITVSIVVLAAIAIVSATHDTAIDGFYLSALNKEQQALYVGVQTTAYKFAWLAGNGGLVFLAGYLANLYAQTSSNNVHLSLFGSNLDLEPLKIGWALAFFISGIIFLTVYAFQTWYLPFLKPNLSISHDIKQENKFAQVFKTYFEQDKIVWIVIYITTFRLGDAFMLKMAPPFLMDKVGRGGLGLPTTEIGFLYGIVGIVFLLFGGIIGGYLVAKQGLKKWLWPTAIIQNSAILLYWILAAYKPGSIWIYIVNSYEQFSYGIGVSAYTVFLMSTVRSEYEASHYAITTALMSTGMFIPGLLSGYLQTWMGYEDYFLISFFATIPGLIAIFFLPLGEEK
ncbi:MAG: MFS transporter [Chroococcidiopsidaceae cyanobacterium CP_BM_RX_35]|nr:MFS transporter [Chroococcidiopsidaceae cyanobacterium CP_BM_RX_35]